MPTQTSKINKFKQTQNNNQNSNSNGNENNDNSDETSGENANPSSDEGISTALIGGVFAIVALLIIGLVVLLVTGGKKDGATMPAIPSLAEAQAQLSGASTATASTASSGQTGEMVPTGKPCKHCGAMEVHHIPSYNADYCKACSQYN